MKKLLSLSVPFLAASLLAQSVPSSKDAVDLAIQWSQEARQSSQREVVNAKYQGQAATLLSKLDARRKTLVKAKPPRAPKAALDTVTTEQFTHVTGLHELVVRAWYLQALEQQATK